MEKCSYCLYHDSGWYSERRNRRMFLHPPKDFGIAEEERFDIMDNWGKYTLLECIAQFHDNRKRNKREPVEIKFVVQWIAGSPKKISQEDFFKY